MYAAATAPLSRLYLIFGSGSFPSFTQGGTFFAYDGVVPSGYQLGVNCATWTLDRGLSGTWAWDYSKVRYSPGPSWFELDTNQTPLTGVINHTTGAGTTMGFIVQGPRCYLNA